MKLLVQASFCKKRPLRVVRAKSASGRYVRDPFAGDTPFVRWVRVRQAQKEIPKILKFRPNVRVF